ncbi:MAG: methyltransferase domain-containing protein [Bacteroidia bacterium]|nr:methyltransferase domain-containing protein [Bacteroidia bacterium]
MNSFKQRSYELELLDQSDIPSSDLYRNLEELNTINTLLGGHAVTLNGMASFVFEPTKTYTVLDIGCGGGDNLRSIAIWARKKGIQLQLVGLDLKADCIEFAQKRCKDFEEISFVCSDYKSFLAEPKHRYDIILNSLFCHHFKEKDLAELFTYMRENSDLGFFVNDLHRNPLAYYSIKWITQFFSRSYLIKNDACLSVKRGFSREELKQLLPETAFKNIKITWKWAFRWLIVFKHDSYNRI